MFEISIITVNYNNANGLQRTLASLDSQVLENVEFIIIDGESQDASVSIIEDFCANNKNSKYVSEVDSGIYDAMNKGLRLAQGKLIGFLNSGDELNDPTVLTDLREFFYHSNRPAAIYGNKKYQSQDGQITRYWKPGQFCKWKYWIGWMTPHQSTYIRNDIYKAQLFDVNYQIAADYKIMFDIFYKQNNKPIYFDRDIIIMESGGISNSGFKNIIKSNYEVLKVWYQFYNLYQYGFFPKTIFEVISEKK